MSRRDLRRRRGPNDQGDERVARQDGVRPALAERLVRVLFDHRSDLDAASPAAEDIRIETATRTRPALNSVPGRR
jgi:hypothetical protein